MNQNAWNVKYVIAQICDALDSAHRKAITHRDLKPGNILVTKQGIKLLDFGLARMAPGENDPTLTRPGMVMGTPAYMSPEQWEGKPGDARSDIYAFGCVLYEMLTGKRVAQERTPVEPVALEGVLATCLEKDPEDRWQSARDLKAALGLVGQAHGLSPTGHGPVPRRWPWIAVAALAVVAAVALWAPWRVTRPTDRPLMRFSADLGPEAVEGRNITAAISPDGTRLAFVARGPGGKQQLATRLLDQAQATLLGGTENAFDAFFSPDGQWIGFFADGKMNKISVQGGAAVTIWRRPRRARRQLGRRRLDYYDPNRYRWSFSRTSGGRDATGDHQAGRHGRSHASLAAIPARGPGCALHG